MRGRKIFLLLILVGLIFSQCDSSSVRPAEHALDGQWSMVWEFQDDELHGIIHFEDGLARMEAFGHGNSQLLSNYEAATFTYSYGDGFLTLINDESNVKLPYTVLESSEDEILLSYLEEIQVRLSRKIN